MAYLASPRVVTFLLMTAVLGLLLCGNDLLQVFMQGGGAARREKWIWLVGNLAVFALFFWWTWQLDDKRGANLSGATTWAWPMVAMLVGLAAVLSCFSARSLFAWLRVHWHLWAGAAIIVFTYVMWIGNVQETWRWTSGSTIAIAEFVLENVQSKDVVVRPANVNLPVIGLKNGGGLTVTRFCAEMESIAAFWVIGLTVLAATWRSNRKIRFLCLMVAGTGMMYLLNGGRLAMLVLVRQLTTDGNFAVNLAHSRVSGILFLAFTVVLLLVTHRWWHRSET